MYKSKEKEDIQKEPIMYSVIISYVQDSSNSECKRHYKNVFNYMNNKPISMEDILDLHHCFIENLKNKKNYQIHIIKNELGLCNNWHISGSLFETNLDTKMIQGDFNDIYIAMDMAIDLIDETIVETPILKKKQKIDKL